MADTAIRVTVWGENVHERTHAEVRKVYPDGMHAAVAAGISELMGGAVVVRTATLDQQDHGLGAGVLDDTDVLTWWGHAAHEKVADAVVEKVHQRVLQGMGLVVLHSGHYSKIFKRLMGTTCSLRWREENDREVVWTVNPTHPIAEGVPASFIVPREEMYGEFFDVPPPDDLVFISSFTGGEVFRSGCCYTRGWGRIFYFRPGHETHPTYYQPEVRRVIANAVRWTHGTGYRRERPYGDPGLHAPTGWYETPETPAQPSTR